MSEHRSIADELITRGWIQGAHFNAKGSVCLRGAAIASTVGLPELSASCWSLGCDPRVEEAIVAIVNAIGSDDLGVAGWNDEPGRTFDEVLRVAKHADEILGAQR